MAIFEGFSDERGSALLGWPEPGVLYARWEHVISAEVAARFALRFTALVGSGRGLRYFIDSSAVQSYELDAMATVADALRSTRAQFQFIVALPWQGVLGESALQFAAEMECLEYATTREAFAERLRAAAPVGSHLVLRGAAAPPPVTPQQAYTYVFDLTRFEEGQFSATRRRNLAIAPAGAWVCIAMDDEHALQLARQAARSEWALPRSRGPECFTVEFTEVGVHGKPRISPP